MNTSIYIDTEVHEGVLTYKWNRKGDQNNYIYETLNSLPVNRVTVSIYQGTSDNMDFGPRNSTLPTGILNLPGICTLSKTCSNLSCDGLRAFGADSEVRFS